MTKENDSDRNENIDYDCKQKQAYKKENEEDYELEKKWNDINESYRRHYPNITIADIDYSRDGFTYMIKRVAARTNRSSQEVTDEIRNWDSRNANMVK